MAERQKSKAFARTARNGRRAFHGPGPWPNAAEALAALTRAWMVTTIATALLVAALAVAPIWDTAIYLRALHDTLGGEGTPALPAGQNSIGPEAGSKIPFGP
jgi:hypothetical protein